MNQGNKISDQFYSIYYGHLDFEPGKFEKYFFDFRLFNMKIHITPKRKNFFEKTESHNMAD